MCPLARDRATRRELDRTERCRMTNGPSASRRVVRGGLVAAALAALVVWAGACASPSAPSGHPLAGTWKGQGQDSLEGPVTIELDITQNGTALSGTWSMKTVDPDGRDDAYAPSREPPRAPRARSIWLSLHRGCATGRPPWASAAAFSPAATQPPVRTGRRRPSSCWPGSDGLPQPFLAATTANASRAR